MNEVADQSHVSRAQMFNVLRGNSSPSLDWTSKVASALCVYPWELLAEPEQMMPPAYPPGAPDQNGNYAQDPALMPWDASANEDPWPGQSS